VVGATSSEVVFSVCALRVNVLGTGKLSVDGPGDSARVFQVDPGGEGPGAVVEEIHLQDHRASRRRRARIFQVVQLA